MISWGLVRRVGVCLGFREKEQWAPGANGLWTEGTGTSQRLFFLGVQEGGSSALIQSQPLQVCHWFCFLLPLLGPALPTIPSLFYAFSLSCCTVSPTQFTLHREGQRGARDVSLKQSQNFSRWFYHPCCFSPPQPWTILNPLHAFSTLLPVSNFSIPYDKQRQHNIVLKLTCFSFSLSLPPLDWIPNTSKAQSYLSNSGAKTPLKCKAYNKILCCLPVFPLQ